MCARHQDTSVPGPTLLQLVQPLWNIGWHFLLTFWILGLFSSKVTK